MLKLNVNFKDKFCIKKPWKMYIIFDQKIVKSFFFNKLDKIGKRKIEQLFVTDINDVFDRSTTGSSRLVVLLLVLSSIVETPLG